MSVRERFISYLSNVDKSLAEKEANKQRLDKLIKEDKILQSCYKRKEAIKKITYVIVILFFLIINIFVRYSNTIVRERAEEEYNAKVELIHSYNIPTYRKVELLNKQKEIVKEKNNINKLTLSLLVSSSAVILFGTLVVLDKKNYFLDEDYTCEI